MSSIPQIATELQGVELPEGPVFNAEIMEYEVWNDGEIVAYARDYGQAWQSYRDIIHYEGEYARRQLLAEQVTQ